ncbi:hypothetical protein [Caminibacter sp.]
MSNLAEKIEFTEDGEKVIIPKKLWQEIIEELEDYGLLKAMEEAKDSPSLTKEEAKKALGIKEFDRNDLYK